MPIFLSIFGLSRGKNENVLELPKNHFKDLKKVADFPYVRGGRGVNQHMENFCRYFLKASLSNDLGCGTVHIRSASAGSTCPADPRNNISERKVPRTSWRYKTGYGQDDWVESGSSIVLKCNCHSN